MNTVQLIGNLTRDPDLRKTPNDISVCSFSVALNRVFGTGDDRKEEVTYVDVECWKGLADTVGKWCKKGKKVAITGRLKLDQWKSEDGSNRSKIMVSADNVEFLSPNQTENTEDTPSTPSTPSAEATSSHDTEAPF